LIVCSPNKILLPTITAQLRYGGWPRPERIASPLASSTWSVVPTVDAGAAGNQFYAVTAVSSKSVYATGNQSGSGFPTQVLTEHWDGSKWSVLGTPSDPTATPVALGITGTDTLLNVVGDAENSVVPYTTVVAGGAPSGLSVLSTPNSGAGENDLFGATTAADGSTWAVGWAVDPSSLTHFPLTLQGVSGTWAVVPILEPATAGLRVSQPSRAAACGPWASPPTMATSRPSSCSTRNRGRHPFTPACAYRGGHKGFRAGPTTNPRATRRARLRGSLGHPVGRTARRNAPPSSTARAREE